MLTLRFLVLLSRLFCTALILGAGSRSYAQDSAASVAVPTATADYLLRPADILQVKIFQEDDLTREVSVSQERTISLPLIGTVDVRNRSARQVEEIIRQLYDRDFLVNPQVNLIVLRYAERSVNIIGAVNSPQAVPFPPERGLSLLDGIARAGGFSRLADRSKVSITRTDDNGEVTTFTIDAARMIGGRSNNTILLQVNDVVNVPERIF